MDTLTIARGKAYANGEELDLDPFELALLCKLATTPDKVIRIEELLDGNLLGPIPSRRRVDAYACRLRHKLRGFASPCVVNVWGVGYRLRSDGGPTIEISNAA